MSKMVRAAWLCLPMMLTLGCGSSIEWEPATVPPETLVPPPPIPGEGKVDDDLDAFDSIPDSPPAATGSAAAPAATAAADAGPAPSAAPSAAPPKSP